MKKLRIWMVQKKISAKDLAKQLDVSDSHLRSCLVGMRPFGKNLAKKIEETTGGTIKASELLYPEKKTDEAMENLFEMKCPDCGHTVSQIIEINSKKEKGND